MTSLFLCFCLFLWGGGKDYSVPSPLYATLDAHLQKEPVFCDPLEGLDEVRSQSEAVSKPFLDCLRGERGEEGEGKRERKERGKGGMQREQEGGREGGREEEEGGRKRGREQKQT